MVAGVEISSERNVRVFKAVELVERRLEVVLECLRQEAKALDEMDVERLAQVVAVKARAFDALAHDHQRARHELSHCLPSLEAHVSRLQSGPVSWVLSALELVENEFDTSAKRLELREKRQGLHGLIEQVRGLQARNSTAVQRSLGWVDACIEELAGGTGSGTYDAQGRRGGARGRGLGRVMK